MILGEYFFITFSFSLELFALETSLDRSPIGYNLLALDFKGTLLCIRFSASFVRLRNPV